MSNLIHALLTMDAANLALDTEEDTRERLLHYVEWLPSTLDTVIVLTPKLTNITKCIVYSSYLSD